MPATTQALKDWDAASTPTEEMAAMLVADLVIAKKEKTIGKVATRVNREMSGTRSLFTKTARSAKKMEAPFMEALIKKDKDWADIEVWQAMKTASRVYTPAYLAAAVDLKMLADGTIVRQEENRRIHVILFWRTLEISFLVTLFCFLLGYPVAYMLATLPARTSNLLLILVLLPFWTSLLVRTTAWIAMLQAQGVLNDLFVVFGLAADDDRFSLIYNKTGTLIAMTHILLPFMILPLYSVMKTIPPSYVRAAKSMGATNWTAFWRVYFPQSVPGIGAGALLVFILAIGYYITPALVGGQDGQMISNFIDFHMRKSLNWNLAAAMGLVMLVFVLFMFWIYDRIVGIDNMKLG
jgi:putative spermidine/putrescine transport system permease protein